MLGEYRGTTTFTIDDLPEKKKATVVLAKSSEKQDRYTLTLKDYTLKGNTFKEIVLSDVEVTEDENNDYTFLLFFNSRNVSAKTANGTAITLEYEDRNDNSYILWNKGFMNINLYFKIPNGSDGVATVHTLFNGNKQTITGIRHVEKRLPNASGTAYRLNGQRVTKPQRGIFIINGKKTLLK